MTRAHTRSLLWAVTAVGVAAIVLATITLVWHTTLLIGEIREEQKVIRAAIAQTERVAEAVEACTVPPGDCYERTTRAVEDINRITILASACAKQPDVGTVAQVQRCVERELALLAD